MTGPGVNVFTTLDGGDGAFALYGVVFQAGGHVHDAGRPQRRRHPANDSSRRRALPRPRPSSLPRALEAEHVHQDRRDADATSPRARCAARSPGSVTTTGKLALTLKGKPVSTLKTGRYRITVLDETSRTAFKLQRLGKAATTVTTKGYVGRRTVTVALERGQWMFYSSAAQEELLRRHRLTPARARIARMSEAIDVVVIGGGQAGLATSYELTQAGVEHVVLERGRVGQTWRGRWDSFCLVTPNWTVQLPGHGYDGDDPDGYMPRDEIVGVPRALRGRLPGAGPRGRRGDARSSRRPTAASCSRPRAARSARGRSSSRPAPTSGRTGRRAAASLPGRPAPDRRRRLPQRELAAGRRRCSSSAAARPAARSPRSSSTAAARSSSRAAARRGRRGGSATTTCSGG